MGSCHRLALAGSLTDFEQPTYVLPLHDAIYVSEMKRVRRVTALGNYSAAARDVFGQFSHPTGLAVAEDGGDVYVAQQGVRGLQRVRRIDHAVRASVGGMDDAGDEKIDSALGVAVAASGIVFVADVTAYRVQAYSAMLSERVWSFGQGSVSDDFKQRTGCTVRPSRAAAPFLGPSCFNPHSLAWSESKQKLYVADADNGALFVLSPRGELVRTIRDATLFTTPRGLGLTRDGHLLVAERQRVALLGARGTRLLAQATIPDAVSMLGVGVDARSGAMYVADPAAGKVFVLRAESAPCERSGAVR